MYLKDRGLHRPNVQVPLSSQIFDGHFNCQCRIRYTVSWTLLDSTTFNRRRSMSRGIWDCLISEWGTITVLSALSVQMPTPKFWAIAGFPCDTFSVRSRDIQNSSDIHCRLLRELLESLIPHESFLVVHTSFVDLNYIPPLIPPRFTSDLTAFPTDPPLTCKTWELRIPLNRLSGR